ncbi:quinolinate synthase NadA [Candidatus Peregrinibacteria bacterium]|nr:MAG: quinolinate synthase NadA [Candidatus Peregrinibacteria bacterium]
MTPEDVRKLKAEHPNAGVICYVNTSAAVKAECDACVTSSNVLKVIEGMPQEELIFLPDEFMAKNVQKMTKKKIIGWKGRCIVHEEFTPETVEQVRHDYPGVKILAHTECSPAVIAKVDMAGGTQDMINYIQNSNDEQFMLVTECGMVDRMKAEHQEKKMVGTCALCPFMKKIMLKDILACLKNPTDEQRVELPKEVLAGAKKSLEKMIELTEL